MRISKLTPSKRGQDRWILQLEDGSFLQVGKNQMADFALYDGRELTEGELEDLRRAERHDRFQSYALRVLMDTPMSRSSRRWETRQASFRLSGWPAFPSSSR